MRNAKGDLKQIREINCLHTFDEFASEALPYWIERAESLKRVKSKWLPLRETREQAQRDLDKYAAEREMVRV